MFWMIGVHDQQRLKTLTDLLTTNHNKELQGPAVLVRIRRAGSPETHGKC